MYKERFLVRPTAFEISLASLPHSAKWAGRRFSPRTLLASLVSTMAEDSTSLEESLRTLYSILAFFPSGDALEGLPKRALLSDASTLAISKHLFPNAVL